MILQARHRGSLNKDQLELSIENGEATLRKVTKVEVVGPETVSTHDDRTRVPSRSLVLELDPDGNAGGPAGGTLLCRGEAKIGGVTTKVALFRNPPAAAAGAAAKPAAAPGSGGGGV